MSVIVLKDVTKEALAAISGGLSKGVLRIASEIETDAKVRIQTGTKSGRFYRVKSIRRRYATEGRRARLLRAAGARGKETASGKKFYVIGYKVRQASASGEAPANDTSNLVNGIRARRVARLVAETTASAEYAEILEERRNRPFFGPAVEKIEDRIEEIVSQAIDEQLPG